MFFVACSYRCLLQRKGLTTTVASQDFVNGNLRPVLGFFWMLIQKYQLVSNQSMSYAPTDNEGTIYDWVAKYVRDYPGMADVKLSSPQDFRDGKVRCYVVALFCFFLKRVLLCPRF